MGLQNDWCKLINHLSPHSKTCDMAVSNAVSLNDPTLIPTQPPPTWAITDGDDDCITPSSEVPLTRPSSQGSTWLHVPSTSEGLDSAHNVTVWPPGAFDDDEVTSTPQAVQTAKQKSGTGAFTSTTIYFF